MNTTYNKILSFYVTFAIVVASVPSESSAFNISVGSCVVQVNEMCNSEFIRFYLSSSARPNFKPILLNNKKPLLPDWALAENDFKILIHGYAGGIQHNQTKSIETAYLSRNNTNIIIVDWGKLAILPCYPTAVINTKQAGECISKFLMKLQDKYPKFQMFHVHLIGLSLGAHVAGFVGNSIEHSKGKKIRRITGLDAALPFFANPDTEMKLDANDAKFVDVIHTNMGIFGKMEPSGHVDFYVNGGYMQPSCNGSRNSPLCSHLVSVTYFAESIHSAAGFWGIRCPSYFQFIFGQCESSSKISNSEKILMGEKCSPASYGIVLVRTNSQQPYALGRRGALSILNEKMYPEPSFYGSFHYLNNLHNRK